MTLQNDRQLSNTRGKLMELEALIAKKEANPTGSQAYELSLRSMRRLAQQLRAEIEEYQRSHQAA